MQAIRACVWSWLALFGEVMNNDIMTVEGRAVWKRRLQTKRIDAYDECERIAFLQALELLDQAQALPIVQAHCGFCGQPDCNGWGHKKSVKP